MATNPIQAMLANYYAGKAQNGKESISISELPSASEMNDADVIPVVQDGQNKKVSYKVFRKLLAGEVSDEQLAEALADYLAENPIQAGATTEQAAQIEENKENIDKLSETVNNLEIPTYILEKPKFSTTDDTTSVDLTTFESTTIENFDLMVVGDTILTPSNKVFTVTEVDSTFCVAEYSGMYLAVPSGATAEQAAQIEENKTNIGKLSKEINALKENGTGNATTSYDEETGNLAITTNTVSYDEATGNLKI